MSFKMACASAFKKSLAAISPVLHTKVLYFVKYKKRIDLKDPKTINEKVLKLKLERYNKDPLVKKCADKYRVRQYIEEKGYKDLLNELYCAVDDPEDIPWDELPDSFAVKLNIGCGYNYFVPDKSKVSRSEVVARAKEWLGKKPWLEYAEFHYNAPKKILIEKFIKNEKGTAPEDYKVYCFNGKPIAVLYMEGRFSENMATGFFDTDWNYLGSVKRFRSIKQNSAQLPEKPASLETMLKASAALSKDFPFVRIDYYESDGKAIFGEMTFTPAAGFHVLEVDIHGEKMADMLDIEQAK